MLKVIKCRSRMHYDAEPIEMKKERLEAETRLAALLGFEPTRRMRRLQQQIKMEELFKGVKE